LPPGFRATDGELWPEIDVWMRYDSHLPVSSLFAPNAILNLYF
jgi:hypothetical protein